MDFVSILGNIAGFVLALVAIVIAYYKWTYQYWKQKNVPYLEPAIPFGNIANPFKLKESAAFRKKRIYNNIKANGWKHGGIYLMLTPQYLVTDLDYVKNILTKDFQHFTNRGGYYNEKDDPISAHLFAVGGQKWQHLRRKLTPAFTSGKMKTMFPSMVECVPNLVEKIETNRRKVVSIDIKEVLASLTTDIIGSCAFGLNCDSFKEEDSPFRVKSRQVFAVTKKRILTAIVCMNFPNLAKKLALQMTPKEVADFFLKIVKDTVSYRKENNLVRKDFMQLLMDLKNEETLTVEEMAAQSYVFFIGGFETSSTTMTFTLYELAKNQEIQDRLRDEIKGVLGNHEGNISYEALQEMKYMDQVIDETLRKYPPLPVLNRKCVKDYKVPDEGIVIKKGTTVLISVLGIHHDEEYYPDPEKFDPERFNEENKAARHHYAYIPFGEGPRMCIGMRFGLMQTKLGLTVVLKDYKMTVNGKTREPLKIKVQSFVPAVEGGVWLDAQKL